MRHYYLTISILILFFQFTGIVTAQEEQEKAEGKAELSVGADLMSRYIWRGTQFSTGPSIQPALELGLGNFAIGTWGAYSFNGMDGAEADVYLSYTFAKEKLSIIVTDYFFPNEIGGFNNYFEYDKDASGHVFEALLSFNGTEKLPMTFLVATNLYGADAKRLNDDSNSADFNTVTGNQYSIYMELGYSTSVKDATLDLFAGFTPTKPKAADVQTGFVGESGFYGDTWGFVNIGATASKELKITDSFSLPISTSLITNPMAENIYIVFGFTF